MCVEVAACSDGHLRHVAVDRKLSAPSCYVNVVTWLVVGLCLSYIQKHYFLLQHITTFSFCFLWMLPLGVDH